MPPAGIAASVAENDPDPSQAFEHEIFAGESIVAEYHVHIPGGCLSKRCIFILQCIGCVIGFLIGLAYMPWRIASDHWRIFVMFIVILQSILLALLLPTVALLL